MASDYEKQLKNEISTFNAREHASKEREAESRLDKKMRRLSDRDGYDIYWRKIFSNTANKDDVENVCVRLKMNQMVEDYSYTEQYIGYEKDYSSDGTYSGTIDSSGRVELRENYSTVSLPVIKEGTRYARLKAYWFYYREGLDPWKTIDELIKYEKYRKTNEKSFSKLILFSILTVIFIALSVVLDFFLWFSTNPVLASFLEEITFIYNNPYLLFYISGGIKLLIMALFIPLIHSYSSHEVKCKTLVISLIINFFCVGIVALSRFLIPIVDSYHGFFDTLIAPVIVFAGQYIFPIYFLVFIILSVFHLRDIFFWGQVFKKKNNDFANLGGLEHLEKLERYFASNKYPR